MFSNWTMPLSVNLGVRSNLATFIHRLIMIHWFFFLFSGYIWRELLLYVVSFIRFDSRGWKSSRRRAFARWMRLFEQFQRCSDQRCFEDGRLLASPHKVVNIKSIFSFHELNLLNRSFLCILQTYRPELFLNIFCFNLISQDCINCMCDQFFFFQASFDNFDATGRGGRLCSEPQITFSYHSQEWVW